MRRGCRIAVIIPARDEQGSIGSVVRDLPDWVDDIVVVDNGSHDSTSGVAKAHGARVRWQPEPGYGAALMAGIEALIDSEEDGSRRPLPDIVAFLDGDGSDAPEELKLIVDPVARCEVDFCVGSRALGLREGSTRTPTQRLNKAVWTSLVNLFWGTRYTDIGPLRALRLDALLASLPVKARYGWGLDMQIRAVRADVRIGEAAVSHRRRRAGAPVLFGTWSGGRRMVADSATVVARNLIEATARRTRAALNRLPSLRGRVL